MLTAIRHKALLVLGIALLAVVLSACGGGPESTAAPSSKTAPVDAPLSTAQLLERVKTSIVLVYAEQSDGYYNVGTGIVFSEDGLALTNQHVIKGSNNIWAYIKLPNDVEWGVEAALLGEDEEVDLALIQLGTIPWLARSPVQDPMGPSFPWPAPLGSVKDIEAGDEVVALGYPLEDANTESNRLPPLVVTRGAVSRITNDGVTDVIEHTAELKDGNSGGPLVTNDGLVIGVNAYSSGFSLEISNAITIDEAISRMNQIETGSGSP